MSGSSGRWRERWIALLLLLYPPDFRRRFGAGMSELFLARVRGAPRGWRRWLMGIRLVADMTWAGMQERLGRRAGIWRSRPVSEGMAAAEALGVGRFDGRTRRSTRSSITGKRERTMKTLMHDMRDTLRRIARAPGFSLAAIAIVALGIGVNTAVFTVVNAVLLRPPPYADHERVVRIYQDSDDGEPSSSSFPAYLDMAGFDDVFASVSAGTPANATWERPEGPVPATVDFVTSSYIDVLGLQTTLGRWFEPAHDRVGAGYFAVVSHRTWQSRMGADPGVVGTSVRLNGRPVTVIGVGPERYNGVGGAVVTDFWLSVSSVEVGGSFRVANLDRRQDHWYDVQARLAPGVTLERAQEAMDILAARLAEEYPDLNEGRDITVFRAADITIHPEVDAGLAPVGILVMGIAGVVLLLACSNLANLLLVKGIARGPEVAVRRALGASRRRIAGLFLGEALILAALGGVVGIGLAYWALGFVDRLPGFLPIQGNLDLRMDGRVLLFTTGLVGLSAIFFGLAPALRSMRSDPAVELGSESRSVSQGRGASVLQGSLVTVQVAASVVLLVGASLLVRSLTNLQGVDPGFDPSGVAYLRTTTDIPGLSGAGGGRLLEEVRAAVARTPGIEEAALTSRPPLAFGGSTTTVVEGYDPPTGTGSVELDFAFVTEGYFEVLQVPIVDGRGFGPDDGPEGEPVLIVNETAARRFWAGDAVGGRVRPQSAPDAWRRVVGVVGDYIVERPGEGPVPMLFYPAGRDGMGQGFVVARGSTGAEDVLSVLRAGLREVSPALPLSELGTLESRMGAALRAPRVTAALLGVFALLAVLLASVGIYSVVSFSVARRTADLGIRIALGADRGRLVVNAVFGMLKFVVVGLALGVGLAVVTAPLIGGMLFGLPALDPASFMAATLLLVALSAIAAWIPARRVVRSELVDALRGS